MRGSARKKGSRQRQHKSCGETRRPRRADFLPGLSQAETRPNSRKKSGQPMILDRHQGPGKFGGHLCEVDHALLYAECRNCQHTHSPSNCRCHRGRPEIPPPKEVYDQQRRVKPDGGRHAQYETRQNIASAAVEKKERGDQHEHEGVHLTKVYCIAYRLKCENQKCHAESSKRAALNGVSYKPHSPTDRKEGKRQPDHLGNMKGDK